MPRGGARVGAGRPPTNLQAIVSERPNADGTVTELTVIDRIEETLRQGAMVKDAAARVGVSVETLRRWQTTGVRARLALDSRAKERSDLSRHERDCVELANRMELAEANARTALLALGNRLAQGGYQRGERTEKRDAAGNVVEVTERTYTAEPDARMIQWLLSHRWPEDFGRHRMEVTGADGGPVIVDAEPIADRLRTMIAEAKANSEAGSREALEAHIAGATNGNGTNGHGNGAAG